MDEDSHDKIRIRAYLLKIAHHMLQQGLPHEAMRTCLTAASVWEISLSEVAKISGVPKSWITLQQIMPFKLPFLERAWHILLLTSPERHQRKLRPAL